MSDREPQELGFGEEEEERSAGGSALELRIRPIFTCQVGYCERAGLDVIRWCCQREDVTIPARAARSLAVLCPIAAPAPSGWAVRASH